MGTSAPLHQRTAVLALPRRLKGFGRSGIPWVAELRDRWLDDPYAHVLRWRVRCDQALEKAVLRTAAGIVTVSEPWTRFYSKKYRKLTITVMNGFDPAGFSVLKTSPERSGSLTMLHMGTIYQDRRDPTPLCLARLRHEIAANLVKSKSVVSNAQKWYPKEPSHDVLDGRETAPEAKISRC